MAAMCAALDCAGGEGPSVSGRGDGEEEEEEEGAVSEDGL